MDGHQQNGPLVATQACCMTCREESRQQPARGVDGGHESDQCGGLCHGRNKQGQNRAKGYKTDPETEKSAIQ